MNIDFEKYIANKNIHEYKIIETSEIPFSQEVIKACKSNKCGRYGSCWTCPPGAGEAEDLKKKILSFNSAFVFTSKFSIEEWFDFEGMAKSGEESKKILLDICSELKKDDISFMPLGCSSCNICKKCTYPKSPCRFPEKAVIPLEACSIDVVKLALDTGIKYYNGEKTITYFSLILYNR